MAEYSLPDLPYDYAALEPHVSGQIMELHHDKHHAAYVTGANQTLEKLAGARDSDDFGAIVGLEKTLAFHISGHVLHSIFWKNLSPDGGGQPDGALASAIDENFGSFDKFNAHMTQATTTIQGSGWGALAYEPLAGRLIVEQIYDHQGNVGQGSVPLAGLRRLGARVLPSVQEREGGLLQGAVEHRELVRRGGAPRLRPRASRSPADALRLTSRRRTTAATRRIRGGVRDGSDQSGRGRCRSQRVRVGSCSSAASRDRRTAGRARAVGALAEPRQRFVHRIQDGAGAGEV